MIVAVGVAAIVAAYACYLGYICVRALLEGAMVARDRADAERREWANERHRLLVNIADEQNKARAERTVLLNRIQDPVATAMTSNVMLVPPTPSEDLSLEPDH